MPHSALFPDSTREFSSWYPFAFRRPVDRCVPAEAAGLNCASALASSPSNTLVRAELRRTVEAEFVALLFRTGGQRHGWVEAVRGRELAT